MPGRQPVTTTGESHPALCAEFERCGALGADQRRRWPGGVTGGPPTHRRARTGSLCIWPSLCCQSERSFCLTKRSAKDMGFNWEEVTGASALW
mmetsp:Transcript_76590/g.229847  ORF Transcript_76590/g.229847 Transcript_76590/m.229847 type:complete len:93 (+) Transcript_76590:233-511(+)